MLVFRLVAIVLAGLMVVPENGTADEIITNKVGGITFSVPREYVFGWRVVGQRGNLPEYLGVAFSVPSHVPFGNRRDADGKLISSAERRQQIRARGEDIIDLLIEPDRGQLLRYQMPQYETFCRKMGKFRSIEQDGVAGYECLIADSVATRIFPIPISSGRAVLVCRIASTIAERCETLVGERNDGISFNLLYMKQETILKIPSFIDAADVFIAQKMTRSP